ncbi:thioredoxin family protein [Niveibacterium sp. SC-1]|uniref:DUF899 domain-containing protein n=1 Tax=Niveibacterium sp. SC-1 TaxID=3135646 RepID=UPI00311D4EA0
MSTVIAKQTATELSRGEHPVVAMDRWIEARKELLAREKELTRLHDQIARERRALPWVRIEKDYVFDTLQGPQTLADLFEGRSQLVIQHFMLAPGWEAGCKSCSFMADHIDGAQAHIEQRDVSLIVVSRAPLEQIERFRERMGWAFKWVSSNGSSFNYDFGVSFTPQQQSTAGQYNFSQITAPHEELPGISAFYKNEAGEVFRTYSTYGRGVELMMGTYDFLDITSKGRDEELLSYTMEWVRHHDLYEKAPSQKAVAGGCACSAA